MVLAAFDPRRHRSHATPFLHRLHALAIDERGGEIKRTPGSAAYPTSQVVVDHLPSLRVTQSPERHAHRPPGRKIASVTSAIGNRCVPRIGSRSTEFALELAGPPDVRRLEKTFDLRLLLFMSL